MLSDKSCNFNDGASVFGSIIASKDAEKRLVSKLGFLNASMKSSYGTFVANYL